MKHETHTPAALLAALGVGLGLVNVAHAQDIAPPVEPPPPVEAPFPIEPPPPVEPPPPMDVAPNLEPQRTPVETAPSVESTSAAPVLKAKVGLGLRADFTLDPDRPEGQ